MTEHKEQAPEAPKPQKQKKSLWCRIGCVSSAVIFLPVFSLLGLLATQSGQHKLIQWTDALLDELSIEQVEGNLSEGLVLKNLRFQTAGVDTQVAEARLQLQLSCLWRADICIDDIRLQKPSIQIDTALLPPSEDKPDTDSAPMKRIQLPIGIDIHQVAIHDLSLIIDQQKMTLGTFQTAASLNNESGLTLAPTTIQDFVFIHEMSDASEDEPQPQATPNNPIDWAALEQTLSQPLLADLGQQIELPFDMHIQGIHGTNWQYQAINTKGESEFTIQVSSADLLADATGDNVQLQTLSVTSSLGEVQSKGQIQLQADFPLQLNINADLNALKQKETVLLPATKANLTLSGTLKKQTALLLQTQGAIDAELKAEAQLTAPKTPLNIKLAVARGQYPFDGNDPLSIKDVNLTINGDILTSQIQLNGAVSGMGIPANSLDLQAIGHLSNIEIHQLKLNALEGSAELKGDVNWRDGVEWNSHLQLAKMNLGRYLSAFPAVLSGELSSQGQVNQKGWQVAVPQVDIQGTLAQHSLALQGGLMAGDQQGVTIPQLALTYGENKMNAQGSMGKQSDFTLNIHAPNLRGLWADLSAGVTGHIKLNGDVMRPQVDVDLTANHMAFQQMHLNQAVIKGQINGEERVKGELDIHLNGFHYNDISINQLKLAASGDEQKHVLHLTSDGKPVAANLNLTGNFDRTLQRWQGTLSQAMIKSEFGNIQTNQNVAMTFDNKTAETTISAHCWMHSNTDLCFPQAFKVGANGDVPFEIKRFDLALVNKILAQEMLTGNLTGKGHVAWFSDKPMLAELQVKGNRLSLTQKLDNRTIKLDFPQISLNGNLANNNLALKSEVNIHNQGKISTDLTLQDIANARKLGGTFHIHNLNLSLANQLLASDEKVDGELKANLTLGGNLNAPTLNGSVNLDKLTAKMRSLPFDIKDSELALHFAGTSSTLKGYLQTADSRLNLSGDANWKNINDWRTHLRAQADQFKVNIPSMASLKISPDVEISASPKLLSLSGNVDIPWARIAIESLPDSAVEVSADEVILDGKAAKALPKTIPSETRGGMEIRSDLKIKIGDDVRLNAYGLNTNLHGLLSVRQERGNLGLYGEVNLKNGRYASFGQDLLIRKGLISFVGQPSQPSLNIEAIRNPEAMEDSHVTAGVKVTGIASAPSVTIFAEPGMPQDQALSYILTGRSLENSSDSTSSGSVGAALLGMGLAKTGKVVGGIGKAFGINDLNLGTQGVGDSSKVVVSGSITPRLQVKYGVGLFDGLAEVTLRYRLLPQLYVQSVSGVNQAFDFLYQFEF